jgi:hypothetical protein
MAQVSVVAWQAPPMHFFVVRTRPLHVGLAHWVPSTSRPQAPLPSHRLLQASLVQVPFGSWPPLGTLVQVPCEPVRPQDLQTPSQAPPQQKPWAQTPVVHWALLVHLPPWGIFTPQEPAMQMALASLH